jgi:tRNA (adenine37-N6)-methyltransferase
VKNKNDKPQFNFESIGVLNSPYQQRFGIPHQSGVSQGLNAVIKLNPAADFKTALKGLETFSHIWIIFVFHSHGGKKWKPSIRPPRLGGNKKVGVFASRSPHRPNPIGISAVKLERIDFEAQDGPELHVSEVDLMDGTPVLDIKPYIPLADKIDSANSGWANIPITKYTIKVSDKAENKFTEYDPTNLIGLKRMALGIIELDPRPASQKRKIPVIDLSNNGRRFGIDVLEFDVKYEILNQGFLITDIIKK